MPDYAYHLTVQSDLVTQAEFSEPGDSGSSRASGRLDPGRLEILKGFLALLEAQAQPGRKITENIGKLLYETLFAGKIAGHFENLAWSKIQAKQPGTFLTLTLAFQDGVPPEWSALPWEFLYQPDDQSFLATHADVAFSYRRPEWPLASTWHFDEKLRILLVCMQPAGMPPVAKTRLENFLNEKAEQQQALLPPVVLENPQLLELEKALQDCRPHILHLLAHGQFDDNGSRFALPGADGQSERWFGDKSLAELISAYPPRFVLLQACEGGQLSEVRSFANGAAWLVRHNIPAVAAMRYPITNLTGSIFSEALYTQLLKGASIDWAVQSGRRALAFGDRAAVDSHASRDFAAPMLWLRPEQEEKKMYTTIQITTPDQALFEAEVPLDWPVGFLLRKFTETWPPAHLGPSKRFTLQRPGGPAITPALTLREAGVRSSEKLLLAVESLSPTTPVGLTIEDAAGQHYTTAVLLSTSLRQLAEVFLAQQPGSGEPLVELVEAENRELPLDITLYDVGIGDNSVLRISHKLPAEG